MEFKKEIENLLTELKNNGWGRKEIEKELGYNANYISQALSRGGNAALVSNLRRLSETVRLRSNDGQAFLKPSAPGDELNRERAIIKMLFHRVAKLEAERLGIPVEKVLEEMERDTRIALRDLNED